MFRAIDEEEYHERASAGTRALFELAHFAFRDTIDGAGEMHHFVVETGGDPHHHYQADRGVMYELVARYLAGTYEKAEYQMERSPAHEALLDILEMITARARAGETELTVDELDDGPLPELTDDVELEDDEET